MALNIKLGALGAPPNTETPVVLNQLDETLYLALEHPSGVELEFESKKEAEAQRFRFYRRIRKHKASGVHSFDKLVFTITDTTLVIQRLNLPTIRIRNK